MFLDLEIFTTNSIGSTLRFDHDIRELSRIFGYITCNWYGLLGSFAIYLKQSV